MAGIEVAGKKYITGKIPFENRGYRNSDAQSPRKIVFYELPPVRLPPSLSRPNFKINDLAWNRGKVFFCGRGGVDVPERLCLFSRGECLINRQMVIATSLKIAFWHILQKCRQTPVYE